MSARNLIISFSGGETSAYMTHKLLHGPWRNKYNRVLVVFANTGQENEETLEFVNECDKRFQFNTVWLEAIQHHGERKRPSARVVTFESASRDGKPFEDYIQKYGIPNQRFPSCTRDLKVNPIENYVSKLGWDRKSCDLAIGIRADEIDRASINAAKRNLVYPLAFWEPTNKRQINTWWSKQPFRLRLKGYQGNCKWCWKKSFRKHFTLISENPEIYDFPKSMEEKYGFVGPEFRKGFTRERPNGEVYRRTFFRGDLSTNELFELAARKKNSFTPATDDAQTYDLFDPELDVGAGCSESCEVYADEGENANTNLTE